MTNIVENTLITGTLLLAFVIPAVIIAQTAKRKRKAALLAALNKIAGENKLTLSRIDMFHEKLIAWDHEKKILLFTYLTHKTPTVINLNLVSKCYVLKKMNGSGVRSISLQMADTKNQVLHSIPFYEQFADSEMNLKKLDKCSKEWENIINTTLVQRAIAA